MLIALQFLFLLFWDHTWLCWGMTPGRVPGTLWSSGNWNGVSCIQGKHLTSCTVYYQHWLFLWFSFIDRCEGSIGVWGTVQGCSRANSKLGFCSWWCLKSHVTRMPVTQPGSPTYKASALTPSLSVQSFFGLLLCRNASFVLMLLYLHTCVTDCGNEPLSFSGSE